MAIEDNSVSFAAVAARARRHDLMAPRDAVEAILAQAWGDVLGIDEIGMDDNFFALGCDSLKASRAVARIETMLPIELAANEIFRHPTVAGLAAQVRRKLGPDVIAELESILDDASRHQDAGRTGR